MVISFIGGGNQSTRRKPLICRKSLTNFITYCCIEYTSPWTGFELATLVVMGTDCIGTCSCKSNYHTIKTITPFLIMWYLSLLALCIFSSGTAGLGLSMSLPFSGLYPTALPSIYDGSRIKTINLFKWLRLLSIYPRVFFAGCNFAMFVWCKTFVVVLYGPVVGIVASL